MIARACPVLQVYMKAGGSYGFSDLTILKLYTLFDLKLLTFVYESLYTKMPI